jgi:MFS family permease
MGQVLSSAWALLLGVGFLMIGNGMQGTILGVRGEIEGFSTFEMSIVMSSYFVGFLGGSRMAPEMIRRVGHVRVFAALASFISAVMILYPMFTHPVAWSLGRVIVGFCFSGVYVTAESWLNNAADNTNRGKALSAYMIVQMVGIVGAQGLLLVGDPSGYETFVIASVLVSISFAPILLSISPTPAFETTKPMSLRELMTYSPLGCVGMFLMGGVFSAQFGMSAIYGAEVGLSLAEISTFVATFYVGATVLQYPLGWLSDRMDRRLLVLFVAAAGGLGSILGMIMGGQFTLLLVAAFLIGGMSNPLYSLLIAHTNDYLDHEDMAAASGGLVFINGLGAIAGPVVTGWLMGPEVLAHAACSLSWLCCC